MNGEIGIDIHTLCIKHIANENLPKAQEEKKRRYNLFEGHLLS